MAFALLQWLIAGEVVMFVGVVLATTCDWTNKRLRPQKKQNKANRARARARANDEGWSTMNVLLAAFAVGGTAFALWSVKFQLPQSGFDNPPTQPHDHQPTGSSLEILLLDTLEYLRADLKQPGTVDTNIKAATDAFVVDIQTTFTRHRAVISSFAKFKTEVLGLIAAALREQPNVRFDAADKQVAELKKQTEMCEFAMSELTHEETGSAVRIQLAVTHFQDAVREEQNRRDTQSSNCQSRCPLEHQTNDGLYNGLGLATEARDKLQSIDTLYNGNQDLCRTAAVRLVVAQWEQLRVRIGTVKKISGLQKYEDIVRGWEV